MTSISQQQEYMVVKSNDLIQKGRFALSMQQNKLLLYLISKIRPLDEGTEVYEVDIGEFCQLCNITDAGLNYADAKRAIKTLADKSIWITQEDGSEVLVRWLNHVKLNRKTQRFEVTFHADMLPYLYDLQARYTQYTLDNVLTMRSKYGIRLYELLKSYQHKKRSVDFELDELRKRMDAQGYDRYVDFKRYVIETAIADINACTDIAVEYEPYKRGRSVAGMIFTVKKPSRMDEIVRRSVKNRRLRGKKKAETDGV